MTTYTFSHPTDAILGYAVETVPLSADERRRARTSQRRRDGDSLPQRVRSVAVDQAVLGPARYMTPIRTIT